MLDRQILMQVYRAFIRPVPEICDGCSVIDSENLEKVQLEAAMIKPGFHYLSLATRCS